jgi:hypothetical protein
VVPPFTPDSRENARSTQRFAIADMVPKGRPALTGGALDNDSPSICDKRRAPVLNPPLLCSPVSPRTHANFSGEIEVTQIFISVHHDAIQEFIEALDVGG